MAGLNWDVKAYACPNCGQKALVYEGSVKWRSGPRPSRALAKKERFGCRPASGLNQVFYFHCANCATLFYDSGNGRAPHLNVEKGDVPAYKAGTGWPPGSIGDISARIGYDVRDLKMMGYSETQINRVLYGQMDLQQLLKSEPEKRK
jgi:hypothetical protein